MWQQSFHISSYVALNSSAVDHFLILLFTTYFGVKQKGGIASKLFSYSSVRIFPIFVLNNTLAKIVAVTFHYYGSGDVLVLNAAFKSTF